MTQHDRNAADAALIREALGELDDRDPVIAALQDLALKALRRLEAQHA